MSNRLGLSAPCSSVVFLRLAKDVKTLEWFEEPIFGRFKECQTKHCLCTCLHSKWPPRTFFVSEFPRKHVPFFGGVVRNPSKTGPEMKGNMFMAVFGDVWRRTFISKPVFPLTTLDDSELLQLYSRVTFYQFFWNSGYSIQVIARNINSSYSWLYMLICLNRIIPYQPMIHGYQDIHS